MSTYKKLIVSTALFLSVQNSWCDIRINGFATMAAGITTDSDETLYDYDDSFDFQPDSLLGLQATADLQDNVEAVVQIKATGAENWDTKFEWAYVSYKFNDRLKVLAGRQRIPYYLYSSFIDVGYAYHWVRPPQNVYFTPVESIDGISLLFNHSIGSLDSNFHLLVGRDNSEIDISGAPSTYEVERGITLAWTGTYEWLTLRASHTNNLSNIGIAAIEQLGGAWNALAPSVRGLATSFMDDSYLAIANEMEQVYEKIVVDETNAIFNGLGVTIDKEPWLFSAEITELDMDESFIGTRDTWYVSGGYRITPNVLFHVTYGADEANPPAGVIDNIPASLTGGLVPELDGPVAGLRAGTEALLNSNLVEQTIEIIGIRWDFHSSAVFKAEAVTLSDELNDSNDATMLRFAISTLF